MYASFDDYKALYDPIDEKVFNNLAYEAGRIMDVQTTGIDNIRKLKRFFPLDEDDAEAVRRCAARLVNTMYQIQEAEAAAAMGRGYTKTEQGLRRQIISRVEAGNEAISYSETKNAATAIDTAAAEPEAREKLLAGIVTTSLRGVRDANGVNLLYMADYPRRYLC